MKTQLATTQEQSSRLLQCGVSADTADMGIDTDTEKLYINLYATQLFGDIILADWNFINPTRMAILTAIEFIKRNGYGKPIPSFAELYREYTRKV